MGSMWIFPHHLPDSHTQHNKSSWHEIDPHTWIKIRFDLRCSLDDRIAYAISIT